MKILVLDIETRPSLGYIWQLWDQNVSLSQLVEVGEVICFAAKWLDKDKVFFKSVYHHSKKEMVETAWRLMDEADAIIHYNGKAFDIKHLNREFLLAGLTPPSPHKDIDLLSTARARFKFVSNKLDHVADQLGLGNKTEHSGFSLWVGCMQNDKASWAAMKEYNINDIFLTEKLYYILQPWVKNHPNMAIHNGYQDGCPNCGSSNYQKRGFYYTSLSRYQQVLCKDCGKWGKIGKRDLAATVSSVN
jgi:DNA polymerase elongation subunit (family B)